MNRNSGQLSYLIYGFTFILLMLVVSTTAWAQGYEEYVKKEEALREQVQRTKNELDEILRKEAESRAKHEGTTKGTPEYDETAREWQRNINERRRINGLYNMDAGALKSTQAFISSCQARDSSCPRQYWQGATSEDVTRGVAEDKRRSDNAYLKYDSSREGAAPLTPEQKRQLEAAGYDTSGVKGKVCANGAPPPCTPRADWMNDFGASSATTQGAGVSGGTSTGGADSSWTGGSGGAYGSIGGDVYNDGYGAGDGVPTGPGMGTGSSLGMIAGGGIGGGIGAGLGTDNAGPGLRISQEDAKKWTKGIEQLVNAQAQTAAQNPGNLAGAGGGSGGGGLFGGLGGGAFGSLGNIPGLDKAQSLLGSANSLLNNKYVGKVAGAAGLDLSSFKSGLGQASGALNMTSGLAGQASGFASKASSMGGSITNSLANVKSLGNLNLGSVSSAASNLKNTATSLTSWGNLSFASAKDTLKQVQAGVASVQKMTSQAKTAMASTEELTKKIKIPSPGGGG